MILKMENKLYIKLIIFSFFLFLKESLKLKFVHVVCIIKYVKQTKTNLQKYFYPSCLNQLIYAHVLWFALVLYNVLTDSDVYWHVVIAGVVARSRYLQMQEW